VPGGVSERAGVKAGGSNPSASAQAIPLRVVTVESIPVVWKAPLFAGRCQNEGLGRSGYCAGFPPCASRADDSGRSEDAEEGNAVSMRHKAYALEACTRDRRLHYEDASFARSFGPCSSILTMHSRGNSEWWGGRRSITVGQTRGTGRNQHWGSYERTERGSSRVTVSQGTTWRV